MDGKEIVRIIEAKLFELGISKGKFYKDCGINSATMSNWRNGIFTPSPAKLHIIEEYLDVTFSDVPKNETTGMDANADVQRMKEFFATSNATGNAIT